MLRKNLIVLIDFDRSTFCVGFCSRVLPQFIFWKRVILFLKVLQKTALETSVPKYVDFESRVQGSVDSKSCINDVVTQQTAKQHDSFVLRIPTLIKLSLKYSEMLTMNLLWYYLSESSIVS